jgi:dTDP-4-amino-4,6-dideoxygalactose transaminase
LKMKFPIIGLETSEVFYKMSIGQEEKDAVMRVMDRGILSNYQGNWSENFYGGEEIKALEKEWQEYFGVKHAIACNSATSGLWLACAAIGLQQDFSDIRYNVENNKIDQYLPDEVMVTPYSMSCSASIPLHFGAKPVFADIERDYYCLDPESVEKAITERTRAIIVVDLFGQPYDADAINEIAKRYGERYGHKIYVIEDAAQAIGAKYRGSFAGILGDIGVYSLNRHKHIQCGEGGIVVTDDDDLAFKIRLAMNHSEAVINSMVGQSIHNDENSPLRAFNQARSLVGMNMRMTELSAAIAREQLKKLDGILENIREHAKYFPVKVRDGCEHAYYRYAWTPKEFNKQIFDFTLDKYSYKQHYITPLYKMPLFKSLDYPDNICPVCEEVDENIVLSWLKGSDM